MNYNQDSTSSIKFTPGKDSSYRSGSDVGARPTGDPKSRKDFKRVLEKTKDGAPTPEDESVALSEAEDPSEAEFAMEDAADTKKQPLFSLFGGLATTKTTPDSSEDTDDLTVDDAKKLKRADSPLFPKPSVDVKKTNVDEVPIHSLYGDSLKDDGEMPVKPIKDDSKVTTRFSTEQTDLSYVNPMAAMKTQSVDSSQINLEKKTLPATNIQEIINQIVDKVVEIKDGGKTETIITLRNPPLFAGSNVVVTGFDSAKGEFNISFENLTQAAKEMLDQRANRDSLMFALEQKGYAVHIVTTTTLTENRPVIADAQPGKESPEDRRDQSNNRQQGRQQRNRQ